ncbi:FCRL3 protein, partial [Cochlearius cochlearius]|nr:FCRL3 protein [Cochlearius cochlearius]
VPCHPAGAQPSQLIQNPPWTPVFRTETVTLTCQGPGVPGPTEWYINEQLWPKVQSDRINIYGHNTESNSYQCRSPGAGLSPTVTLRFSNDWLMLQMPAQALLEGDALQLRCQV